MNEFEQTMYAGWLHVVSQNGGFLHHVPLRHLNRELCLAAVRSKGSALCYVPVELRTPEICLAAISQNPLAIISSPYSILELMSL